MTDAPSRLRAGLVGGYGAGAFGALLGFALVPLLLLYYLTEIAGLPPAWAGVLLALPKVADVVLDPWLGRRSDRVAARTGSRASVLLFSAWVLPLTVVLLFVPLQGLALWLKAGILSVLLIAQSLLTTVFAVAHTALAGDLAPTLHQRGTLMSARAFGSTLAGLVVAALAPGLIALFGDGQRGFFGMGVALAVLSSGLLLLAWRICRGTPMRAGVEAPVPVPVRLLPALRATLGNRAFYTVAAMLILVGVGTGTLLALMPYINEHVLGRGAAQLPALVVPVFAVLLVGVLLAPRLLRRAGPGGALLVALVVAMMGIAVLAGGGRQPLAMSVGAGAFGFGAGLLTVLVMTLATQAASRSSGGGDGMGLYLGVLFSAEKLGASGSVVLAGIGLDWAGLGEAGAALDLGRLAGLWLWIPMGAMLASLVLLVLQRRSLAALRQ